MGEEKPNTTPFKEKDSNPNPTVFIILLGLKRGDKKLIMLDLDPHHIRWESWKPFGKKHNSTRIQGGRCQLYRVHHWKLERRLLIQTFITQTYIVCTMYIVHTLHSVPCTTAAVCTLTIYTVYRLRIRYNGKNNSKHTGFCSSSYATLYTD